MVQTILLWILYFHINTDVHYICVHYVVCFIHQVCVYVYINCNFSLFPLERVGKVYDSFKRAISFSKSLDSAGLVIQDDFGHFVTHFLLLWLLTFSNSILVSSPFPWVEFVCLCAANMYGATYTLKQWLGGMAGSEEACRQAQNEEIEVLQAIFMDDFTLHQGQVFSFFWLINIQAVNGWLSLIQTFCKWISFLSLIFITALYFLVRRFDFR